VEIKLVVGTTPTQVTTHNVVLPRHS